MSAPGAIPEYTFDAGARGIPAPRIEPFSFTGTPGGYFRIWIVSLLLTILTIGFYSPWAKVRRLRYFYGNTHLAGSAFQYHGRGLQILKGRLIVVGVLLFFVLLSAIWPLTTVLLGFALLLGTPWIVVRARMFHTRMSSYRNIRFSFRQDYGEAARIFIGLAALISLTLGVIYPYWSFRRCQFAITNTSYGATLFGFIAKPRTFYGIYFIALLLWIPVLWGLFLVIGSVAQFVDAGGSNPADSHELARLAPVVLLSIVIPFFLALSFLEKALGNASLGNALIGPHRLLSDMRLWPLLGIYVVNALLIVLTLGLFLPAARVRLARYRLQALSLELHGSLDAFVADQQNQSAAAGQGPGDFLEIDRGV